MKRITGLELDGWVMKHIEKYWGLKLVLFLNVDGRSSYIQEPKSSYGMVNERIESREARSRLHSK